jgi:hypothetical protein
MTQQGSSFWETARKAQNKLVQQYLIHPDVTMIDIGYLDAADNTEQIALRIHVRGQWFDSPPEQRITFPDQVDGIPVAVVRGEYRTGK